MLTKEQIINKLGIEGSTPEVQDKILQDLANSVATRILLELSEQMSEKDMSEVASLLEEGKEDEAEKFINSKVINYNDFRTKIEKETIDELAENTQAVNDQAAAIKSEKLSI